MEVDIDDVENYGADFDFLFKQLFLIAIRNKYDWRSQISELIAFEQVEVSELLVHRYIIESELFNGKVVVDFRYRDDNYDYENLKELKFC